MHWGSCYCHNENIKRNRNKLKKCKTNPRIRWLSQPKNYRKKFVQQRPDKFQRHIHVIREQRISSRLNQLALRPVRYLISAKEEYNHINKFLTQRFNKHINKSMHSLYSRLAKISIPKVENKLKTKWNEIDWENHKKWLAKRALPKQLDNFQKKIINDRIREPGTPRNKIEVDMIRLGTLSAPVSRRLHDTTGQLSYPRFSEPLTKIPKSTLKYDPTDHILKLSEPIPRKMQSKKNSNKIDDDDDDEEFPFQQSELGPLDKYNVPKIYASIKSHGIKKLSQPKKINALNNINTNNHLRISRITFPVSRTALKYKATKNILLLATPKATNANAGAQTDPLSSGVSKNALKKLKKSKELYFNRLMQKPYVREPPKPPPPAVKGNKTKEVKIINTA